jgi:hypothetical protein
LFSIRLEGQDRPGLGRLLDYDRARPVPRKKLALPRWRRIINGTPCNPLKEAPVPQAPRRFPPGGRLTICMAAATICSLVLYRVWIGSLTPLLKPLLDFIPKALLAAYLVSPFVGGLLVMAVWEWLADRRGRRGVPALPEAEPRRADRLESRPPTNFVRPDESGHTETLPASSRLSPPASG